RLLPDLNITTHTKELLHMARTKKNTTPPPTTEPSAVIAVDIGGPVAMVKLEQIALADIDRSRNHRIPQPGDDAKIIELMESIKPTKALLRPVRAYPPSQDHHPDVALPDVLGFGWRRSEAYSRLGMTTIPAMVYPPATDAEIESARGIENL